MHGGCGVQGSVAAAVGNGLGKCWEYWEASEAHPCLHMRRRLEAER